MVEIGFVGHDPLIYLLDTLEQRFICNRDALEVLILSGVSAHQSFTIKLNVALVGDSDSGKSTAAETGLSIFNPKNVYPYHRVSPKALYYEAMGNIKKEILPVSFVNKIVYLDDVTEDTTEILKSIANTDNVPPSLVTVIDGVSKSVKFDARPVVWISSVELSEDYQSQCDRRFFTVEIKTNPEVGKFILDKECNNKPPIVYDNFLKAKEILDKVMNTNTIVDIDVHDYPFAKTNTDKKFFIAMVRSIAKIRNPIDGRIKATAEDIAEAARLYQAHQGQSTKLKEGAIKLLDYIPYDAPTENDLSCPSDAEHTIEKIYADYCEHNPKKSIQTIARNLKSLVEKGEVIEVKGKYNRSYYYVAA